MDMEEALALVPDGGDSDFPLSELSCDKLLFSLSKEEELDLDHLASEDEGGNSDGEKDADLLEAGDDNNDAGDDDWQSLFGK